MVDLNDTRVAYTLLVAGVGIERVIELFISSRNARRLLARGGVELGSGHYPAMVLLHSAFLLACPLEVWWLDRPWIPALGLPMAGLLALAMGLRYWVVVSLDGRWNTRVIVVPGEPLVASGPYRWTRHPNYVAVVVELAALPLIHGAWLTAFVFGGANALVLRLRIRVEDAALAGAAR